ncbi:hypothetical protein K431DRAFT_343586 [Polychaeton citri CBS 116435]|uniref:Uncharacterized protein n=1 Tax=Polychaeton citri CBS 116435 TaxID=1314669 RepID=A0A9P4QGU7_9PEZI|nr:hypothetical protein K431DRAFT_343586 [Polychaeton citri CBS 116435]
MAEVYNAEQLMQLNHAAVPPETVQLGLAAQFMSQLLGLYQVPCVMMGSWATYLRGNIRRDYDVEIAVSTSMDNLRHILVHNPRIYFPDAWGETFVKIYVKVGCSFDVGFDNVPDLGVGVNLILSGNLTIPSNLFTASEYIFPSNFTPQEGPVVVLGIFWQIATKLSAFNSRRSDNDYDDLLFLFRKYTLEVVSFQDDINGPDRDAFLESYISKGNDANDILYLTVLLGGGPLRMGDADPADRL